MPKLVYHGSPNGEIKEFFPRVSQGSGEKHGPQVYASHDPATAIMFMADVGKAWSANEIDGVPYAVFPLSREEFQERDEGGFLYTLPGESFSMHPEGGMGDREWASSVSVKPLEVKKIDSVLDAMMENGVRVYFVTDDQYQKMQSLGEERWQFLKHLQSENKHQETTEYSLSIRITFPDAISKIIKQEKQRFVSEYGSKYKSEPHITLYLTRYALSRNTRDGFSELIQNLQKLSLNPFEISLLDPKVIVEEDRHRNLYVVDVSNKEQLQEVSDQVYNVAARYRSNLLGEGEERGKELEPHITIGEIDFDKSQAEITDVQSNLKRIVGERIAVSNLVVFFYIKEPGEEKARLLEEVVVSF